MIPFHKQIFAENPAKQNKGEMEDIKTSLKK